MELLVGFLYLMYMISDLSVHNLCIFSFQRKLGLKDTQVRWGKWREKEVAIAIRFS